jgi:hypothetical protein
MIIAECVVLDGETTSSSSHSQRRATNQFMEKHQKDATKMLEAEIFQT